MMLYNIGVVFGRILLLFVFDRLFGLLNIIIVMNIFILIVVFVIWLLVGVSFIDMFYLVVVFMGIGIGSFVFLGGRILGNIFLV